ncbi:MAG: hypothetical protein A2Y65_07505 [Deltaproteobacteria bacterium RBG_13_52_11]|nr:MAG: hypothetical protein A2Y65_07505 [Deltaproteobacteria bacterium RBG_13_52_11]
MKKGMMVMTIFVALYMLISISAVAPSFAKQATQTTPTTKQQPPTSQFTKNNVMVHTKFWDLAVDHFVINGQSFSFPNNYSQAKIINVKVGQTVNCQCFYKLRTITIGSITKADVGSWGSGNTYKIAGGLYFPGPPSHQEYKIKARKLPKFTYADVLVWKNQIGVNGNKEWDESLVYNWTAAPEHVGKSMYLHFDVDSFFNIQETDENNNGSFSASGCVAKFIVTQQALTPKDMPMEKLKDNK